MTVRNQKGIRRTMRAEKRKKKSIFLRIALLAFSVYVIIMLVQLQRELGQRQQDLNTLEQTLKNQQALNEDLKNKTENYETYLDQQARDQGYSRPGESIYKEIPGS